MWLFPGWPVLLMLPGWLVVVVVVIVVHNVVVIVVVDPTNLPSKFGINRVRKS